MWRPWYKQYQLHCLNFAKSRAEGRFNWWDLSESNPFLPFSCPPNISPAAKLHIFTYSQGDSLSKSIQTTSRNWVICFEINNSQILVRKLKSPYKEKKSTNWPAVYVYPEANQPFGVSGFQYILFVFVLYEIKVFWILIWELYRNIL